jgi:hypothetical protein
MLTYGPDSSLRTKKMYEWRGEGGEADGGKKTKPIMKERPDRTVDCGQTFGKRLLQCPLLTDKVQ